MTGTSPVPDEAAADALAAHVVDPARWGRRHGSSHLPAAAQIEYALFRARGLGAIGDATWHAARAVSDAAGRRVGRLVRARFGARSPKGGLVPISVFLLTLGMTAPLVFLGIGYRGNSLDPRPDAGAFWTAIIGGAMLVVALCTLGRPVPRFTFFQSQVVCVVLGGLAAIWAFATESPSVRLGLVVGIVGLALTVGIFWFGRARDRGATAAIDSAVDDARAEVKLEVETERERLIADLTAKLAESLPGRDDLAVLRRARNIAFEALHGEGNSGEDLDPDSVPGAHIIAARTSDWLPRRDGAGAASGASRRGAETGERRIEG